MVSDTPEALRIGVPPLGENAQSEIQDVWPSKVRSNRPVATSTRKVQS
jgi:hypothetical protein